VVKKWSFLAFLIVSWPKKDPKNDQKTSKKHEKTNLGKSAKNACDSLRGLKKTRKKGQKTSKMGFLGVFRGF
jgi:hypothetical protein